MSPTISYLNYPPCTVIHIGGRQITIDSALPVKLRLLRKSQDGPLWCSKKQHNRRSNLAEYHYDFSDTEIAFSYSVPRTHIFFAGYMIHVDPFVQVLFESRNAAIQVTSEHWLKESASELLDPEELDFTENMINSVIFENADLPLTHVHKPEYSLKGDQLFTGVVPSMEFINDCERKILVREKFATSVEVSNYSSPMTHPPVKEIKDCYQRGLFWSFLQNELRRCELSAEEMHARLQDLIYLKSASYAPTLSSEALRACLQRTKRLVTALKRRPPAIVRNARSNQACCLPAVEVMQDVIQLNNMSNSAGFSGYEQTPDKKQLNLQEKQQRESAARKLVELCMEPRALNTDPFVHTNTAEVVTYRYKL